MLLLCRQPLFCRAALPWLPGVVCMSILCMPPSRAVYCILFAVLADTTAGVCVPALLCGSMGALPTYLAVFLAPAARALCYYAAVLLAAVRLCV